MMTSHDSSSNVRSSSFDLLDKRLQKWAWQQEWEKLHEIQEKAIKAVMSSPESDVVVAAPTAGGKTEAVFLPILSILAAETEKLIGVFGGILRCQGRSSPTALRATAVRRS